mgnify:CR=1 FL=1
MRRSGLASPAHGDAAPFRIGKRWWKWTIQSCHCRALRMSADPQSIPDQARCGGRAGHAAARVVAAYEVQVLVVDEDVRHHDPYEFAGRCVERAECQTSRDRGGAPRQQAPVRRHLRDPADPPAPRRAPPVAPITFNT